MCFVVSLKMAGVGFRWGITMALPIPFCLLALSFSSKTRSKINKSPLNPHLPPIFACKNKTSTKSSKCLGEALQHHLRKYVPQISPVRSQYALFISKTGYSSGKAHLVSDCPPTISEDKLEEQAVFGLSDGRKASVQNCDRKLSLRSTSSEDSGYASGEKDLVSKNLAAISEDMIVHQAESALLNRPKSHSTGDPVMSFPFYTFGRLYSKSTSSESHPTITDFIAAVSLADYSLWAIYDAWDEDWTEAETGDEVDWSGVERHETPLEPLWSNTWGKLPGIDGRVRMAKIANSVYTHVFTPTEQINWKITGERWGPNEIPVLFPAVKALTGPVTSLTHTSQSNETATNTLKPSLSVRNG